MKLKDKPLLMTEDITYIEFFDVGDKISLVDNDLCGVVVKTFDIDSSGGVIGGSLIICWDSSVLYDFEDCTGGIEELLVRLDESYEFKYINTDGSRK